MKDPKPKSLRILIAIVIIMGLLIVAGLIVIVVTITSRIMGTSSTAITSQWSSKIYLDEGSIVGNPAADGDRLFIKIKIKDGSTNILVFDAETGKQLGKLQLEPKKY
jgi:flagellar basal body-associated protein FliL